MTKNFKYTNTIVIGFDNKDDPKRKDFVDTVTSNDMIAHVLHLAATNILNDNGVSIGDQFRCVEYGKIVKVLEVGFSFENSKPFAVCTDDDMYEPFIDIKYLDELLDIRRWAKMNQYKESDNGND